MDYGQAVQVREKRSKMPEEEEDENATQLTNSWHCVNLRW